jgi:hypothetical protein
MDTLQLPISFEAQMRKAREKFEPQLETLHLTENQINQQNLTELEGSLQHIDDTIKAPESFGTLKLTMTGAGIKIADSQNKNAFEVDIIPLLLERKKLILERIRELKAKEQIVGLRDLAGKSLDNEIRTKIESAINEFKKQSEASYMQSQEVDARLQEEKYSEQQKARLSMEMAERKAEIWHKFLGKESVATLVGATILLLLTVIMVIAMFNELKITEILNNAFMIILGFFFSQAASKQQDRSD